MTVKNARRCSFWVVPLLFATQSVFPQSLPDIGLRAFFPVYRSGDKLSETFGTVKNYAYGHRAGNVTLESSRGELEFFLPRYGTMTVLGRHLQCLNAPFRTFKGYYCNAWPHSIVLGRTTVYVRYFTRTLDGQLVKVADEIRLRP